MKKEIPWKATFRRQVATISYWNKLFKSETNRQLLDRSDAIVIVKLAQRQVAEDILEMVQLYDVDPLLIQRIKDYNKSVDEQDISALGMFHNGKQF